MDLSSIRARRKPAAMGSGNVNSRGRKVLPQDWQIRLHKKKGPSHARDGPRHLPLKATLMTDDVELRRFPGLEVCVVAVFRECFGDDEPQPVGTIG